MYNEDIHIGWARVIYFTDRDRVTTVWLQEIFIHEFINIAEGLGEGVSNYLSDLDVMAEYNGFTTEESEFGAWEVVGELWATFSTFDTEYGIEYDECYWVHNEKRRRLDSFEAFEYDLNITHEDFLEIGTKLIGGRV